MTSQVHILVSGLVQGVGFRYFVRRKAVDLGVKGWVRNLYNGDVEIEAVADKLVLEHFIQEVKTGPRAAWVKDARLRWREELEKFSGFEIR
jgi:acylphosphatase